MGAGSMVPDEEENTHASNVLVFPCVDLLCAASAAIDVSALAFEKKRWDRPAHLLD